MSREYYLRNREAILEKTKQRRIDNPEKRKEQHRLDIERHGEKRRAKQKEWRENNAERHNEQKRRYFQENKEMIYERRKGYAWTPEKQAAYIAEYQVRNKERIRERLQRYKESSPGFRVKTRHLGRVGLIMKSATKPFRDKHLDDIGCKRSFFIAHIESLFKAGMNWDNYGKNGWEIDHVKPCSSFDLTDPEQQKICFHYTNIQPLWKRENMKKGKKIIQAK